jgi:hypothetical protein
MQHRLLPPEAPRRGDEIAIGRSGPSTQRDADRFPHAVPATGQERRRAVEAAGGTPRIAFALNDADRTALRRALDDIGRSRAV